MTPNRFLIAALVTGIAAAAIEMIFVLPIQASLGNSPGIVFQSIASGTMGKNAYIGGTPAVLLGIFYHVLISVVAAGAYIAAARPLPFLYSRPLLCGLLCAIIAYVVMNWVVVPLSAVGYTPTTNPGMMALSFSIHVVGFGWPIAYISRLMERSATYS
ncbi:MAG: hypothetical protein ACTHJR_14220 [Sphingomonas sp.]|uniref:hypothetical protein n=1 Tax=Sphingomonas sp. TaxID=28214 RepID=UPI003F7DF0DE